MFDTEAHPDRSVAVPDEEFPDQLPEFVASVVDCEDRPDECTIYPADATGMDLMTTWITAEKGSYVCLDEMR